MAKDTTENNSATSPEHTSLRVVVNRVFTDALFVVRQRLLVLVTFSLAFKAINFVVLAPLAAWVMRQFLSRWGKASIGNFEIASFLISPQGLLAICVVGGIVISTLYLEIAGLMRLMLVEDSRWWFFRGRSIALFQRLLRLGAVQIAVLLLVASPFLLAIWGIYIALWQGRDLNGLIVLRPPEFWWGVGMAGCVVSVLVLVLTGLILRWLFAVPSMLCDSAISPRRALRLSRNLIVPNRNAVFITMAVWFVGQTVCAATILICTHRLLLQLLEVPWQTLATSALITGIVLVLEWTLGTLLSIVGNIGFAAVVLSAYSMATRTKLGVLREKESRIEARDIQFTKRPWAVTAWRFVLGSAVGMLGVSLWLAYLICDTLVLHEQVSVTAHRAGSQYAPENSIAAILRAIEDKANWAEIDVQLTSDNQIVVTHDTDLSRMGGGKIEVGKATLAQIQALDIGSSFSKDFANERIPTFFDLLQVAKGRIRLNVELKPHGAADVPNLTKAVVKAIQDAGMVNQCRICSQSYEGIQLAKSIEPQFEIGFIAAASLGDTTKLKVNYLMLSHKKITKQLVERARANTIQIHAWTVNDPKLVARIVDTGTANIITDDVVSIQRELRSVESLHPIQRLLLRARHGLLE